MKILTVVGARPQFIKAAVVSRELQLHSQFQEVLLHTGQHYDANMSDVFFTEMQLPKPAYNIGINSLTHGAMTARMLEGIENVILHEKPDLVLVYGDTNSTLAGALAATKLHIPVAHVEAGLRSYNLSMPEEINRVLTDRISNFLYCPTQQSINNLAAEGINSAKHDLILCGDVMQDAAIHYAPIAERQSTIINKLNLKAFVLCTVHREENTSDRKRLNSIVNAINKINAEIEVVIPLHPRTKKIVEQYGLAIEATVIEPVGYFDMIELTRNCKLVLTDSGGLQKEAFFFSKLCITLRDETEWTELVEQGFNTLAGAHEELIYSCFQNMLNKTSNFEIDLYGNGKASERLVNHLLTKD